MLELILQNCKGNLLHRVSFGMLVTVVSDFFFGIFDIAHCDHSRDKIIGTVESHVNSNGVIMRAPLPF